MVLPSLYAWFNLKAGWDPYGDTSKVLIAITNEDKGAKIDRGNTHKELNIGDEVVKSLQQNHQLGWRFVNREEAERGVTHGDYYASLLIPEDFSAKLATILEENPESPEVRYTVNEKINAIAPKITAKGASGIIEQVNQNFIKTVGEAIFTAFNQAGIELEKELPTIRNIESRILELEKRLPDIEELANKALIFEQKLPEIREKGQMVVDLEQKLPEIEKAAGYIPRLEEKLPAIEKVGDSLVEVQEKLPEIEKAANRVVEIDQNFYKVEQVLDQAIEDARKADEIISAAQAALPKVEGIAKDGGAFASELNNFLTKNEGAFEAIAPVVKQNLILLQQTTDAVTQLTDTLIQADIDPQPTLDALSFLEERLSNGAVVISRMTDLLTTLNNYLPANPLDNSIQRLNGVQTNFEQQAVTMKQIQTAIERGEQPAKTIVNHLNTLSKAASASLGDILSRYDSEIVPNVNRALTQLQSAAQNTSDLLQTTQEKLPDIKAILDDAAAGIDYGQKELVQLQGNLPAIGEKIHETAMNIQDKMGLLTEGVTQAANFVQNDLPQLESKIKKAADFVRNDLPRAEQEVRTVANVIQSKLPEVEAAVHRIAAFVQTDLPELEETVRNAAEKIRGLEQLGDLDDIIELLKNDIQSESEFLANPVHLKEIKKFPIPNYGSAMSPFYTTLSLWVGGLLLVSLLRVDVDDKEGIYKSYHIYFGRLFTFLTIGMVQALIVTIGDMVVLGAYVADPFWFVLFGIFISFVFVTIVYTFTSVFGNVGKALAIILLVLQLSGSGGTFPIQVSPPFFQAIHPFLPFTYAISLLRETVGGIVEDIVIKDIIYLVVFFGAAVLLGTVLKRPLNKLTHQLSEKAKESGLIH